MADFGITNTGFKRKDFTQLVTELEDRARQLFDDDINLGRTFEGFWIRLYAFGLAAVWKIIEGVFFALFPSSANGINLERVVGLGGVKKKAAARSLIALTVTGTNDSVVTGDDDTGDLFQTAQGIQFRAIQTAVVASGVATFNARAVVAGIAGNVAIASVTEIVNPLTGIDTVTNAAVPFSAGSDIETDIDLRSRFFAGASGGGSSKPGIETLIVEDVEGVTNAVAVVNFTLVTDSDNIPPKAVELVVQGGLDSEVAEAYFGLIKSAGIAAGIEPFGNTLVIVQDQNENQFPVSFTRPTEKLVFITVNMVKGTNFKDAQVLDIETALISHVGGSDTKEGITTIFPGLDPGEDVKEFRLKGAIDDIPNIDDVTSILFGFSALPTASVNLPIDLRESADTLNANIVVNFV